MAYMNKSSIRLRVSEPKIYVMKWWNEKWNGQNECWNYEMNNEMMKPYKG